MNSKYGSLFDSQSNSRIEDIEKERKQNRNETEKKKNQSQTDRIFLNKKSREQNQRKKNTTSELFGFSTPKSSSTSKVTIIDTEMNRENLHHWGLPVRPWKSSEKKQESGDEKVSGKERNIRKARISAEKV